MEGARRETHRVVAAVTDMQPKLLDVQVFDTERVPKQIEVEFTFDDGPPVSIMLRPGCTSSEVANAVHSFGQALKRAHKL